MTVVSKYIRLGLPNEMTTFIDGLIEHLEELYWYEPVRLAHDADIEANIARTIREWLADSQLYHEVKSKVPLFNIASVNHEKLDEIDILVDITHPFRMRVIIEADQARADQLSKKFVSRLSLTSPDSLL